MRHLGHFFPAQPLGPSGQETGIGGGEMALSPRPWQVFNLHPTGWAVDATRGIEEEDQNPPEGDELKASLAQGVVARASLPATGTYGLSSGLGSKSYLQSQLSGVVSTFTRLVEKTWLFCNAIQDSLYLHPVFLVSPR